jgi:hypothetical protein
MPEPDFTPDRHTITAVTNASAGVVTAATHGYATGDIVHILIPSTYGMRLDIYVEITVVNSNSFSIDFETTFLDAFVVPGLSAFTPAQVIPITAETDNIAV